MTYDELLKETEMLLYEIKKFKMRLGCLRNRIHYFKEMETKQDDK